MPVSRRALAVELATQMVDLAAVAVSVGLAARRAPAVEPLLAFVQAVAIALRTASSTEGAAALTGC
jgi:hypothetical protein